MVMAVRRRPHVSRRGRMTAADDWDRRWLRRQRRYWAALTAGFPAASDAAAPADQTDGRASGDELTPGFEHLAALSSEAIAVYRRMLAASNGLTGMGQRLQAAAGRADATDAGWRQTVEQDLAALRRQLPLADLDSAAAWSALSGLPAMAADSSWRQQAQRWSMLAADCAKAHRAALAMLDKINSDTLDLLGERLMAAGAAGAPRSLRAFYDLWVDCGETVYARAVQSEAFVTLNAEIINALLRLKRHEDRMREALLESRPVPMPGRRAWDTVLKRLHAARRDLRALQAAAGDGDLVALRREVAGLRVETAQLKSQLAALQATLDALADR